MKCIECGNEMSFESRDITDSYENIKYTVNKLQGHYCDNCGESIHSREESQKIFEAIEKIKHKSPEKLILMVRKMIGIDQKKAGQIFGGGPNAFSRYETGKSKIPTPLITLFTLIDKHPNLISEVPGLEGIHIAKQENQESNRI